MNLKYVDYDVVFSEIPNETTLAFTISRCPGSCPGCHSPHLTQDIGFILTQDIEHILSKFRNITTVLLLGGDRDLEELVDIVNKIRTLRPELKVALYSGASGEYVIQNLPVYINHFDYIKLGSYVEELGGLNSPKTNQRLYKIENGKLQLIKLY